MPKRLHWYLEREPRAVTAVLHGFLRVVETHLRATIPAASPRARPGAVSFVHRFGSALNRHVHFHCGIIDGLFDPGEDGQVRFLHAPALTTAEMAAITEQVRRRVRRWFARSGLLEPEEARDMLGWEHGGISLDAGVRIRGPDRPGLERLEQINPHQLI